MRKLMSIGLLALSIGVATGCGDSVENNMQRAQIAVNRAKYDHALELADKVLAEQPDNAEAAHIKARSLLQLGKLDAARNTLKELIAKHPDDVELHRMMLRWGVLQNAQTLGNSALLRMEEGRIVTSSEMMNKIDAARQVVMDEAQWLSTEGKSPADAEYARAELAELHIRLLDRRLNLLRTTMARTQEDIQSRDSDIKNLEDEKTRTQDELISRLAFTLDLEPEHHAAALRYNGALIQTRRWEDLWAFINKTSQRKELSENLVSQMVLGLLEVPNNVQPVPARIEQGNKLIDAVPQQRRQTVDWWITSARLHMMAGQYAKAIPLLEQARSKSPRNSDARYLMASSYYHQNQFKQANAILKDLAVEMNRSPNVALLHGMTLRQLGDNGAREAIRRAIELAPDNPLAREQMILINNESGNANAVSTDLQAMYDRDPTDSRALRFMLQFLRAQGSSDKVAELLSRIEQINPRRDEYLPTLVDGYVYLRQYQQAEQTAREWVSRDEKSLEPNLLLARILLAQNKVDQAKELVESLKGSFSQEQGLDDLLGTLYLQQRAYDKAIEYFESALAKDATNIDTRLKLAQAQMSLVLNDDALENVEKVLEQDPTHTEALSLGARILQSQGKADKAAEMLARIDNSRVDARRNPLMAAQIKVRAQEYEEAINILNQALFAGNDDPSLRLMLAGVYIRQGNLGEAEEQLLGLVRSQPDNWLAYSALATFYTQNGMLTKGISTFEGLSTGSNQLLGRLALASLLARANEPGRALEQVQGLLKPMVNQRDPRAMTVASVIASLHTMMNQPQRAKDVFQTLIDANLMVPQATLAQIDLQTRAEGNDPAKSVAQLDALVKKLTPEQRALKFQVVRRYAQLKAFDKALAIVDQWLEEAPQNIGLASAKGNLLMQAGRNEEAARVFAAAVKQAPDNAELWLRLGQSHVRAYQFPQAEQAYESMAKLGAGARAAALTELGQLYSALGLNKAAAQTFEQLDREGNLRDPRIIYALGVAAESLGKPDVAAERFAQVPEASTLYGAAQIRIVQIDQARGKADDARKRLSELARNRNTASMAVQQMLALSAQDKSGQQLLQWSDQMLSLEALPPQQRIAWLNVRANLSLNTMEWVGAAKALEQLAQLQPMTTQTAAMRVLLALRLRQMDQAQNIYRQSQSLQASPLGGPLAALLGIPAAERANLPPTVAYYIALRNGDASQAAAAVGQIAYQPMLFKRDLQASLNRPDVNAPEFKAAMSNLLTAELALGAGMPTLATDIARNVLTTFHGLPVAQSVHARAAGASNEARREVWEKIVKDVPSSDLALLAQSQLAVLDKQYSQAVKSVTQLLANEPGNEFVQYRLAGLLIEAQQPQEAITLLEKIVQQGGRFATVATNDLAYLLAVHQPNRLDEARTLAAKAQEAMPRNPALLDTVGWIDHLSGKNEQALPLLVRASAAMKDSAEVHYHLGVVYNETGNKTWARHHLEAAQTLPKGRDIKGLNEAMKSVK